MSRSNGISPAVGSLTFDAFYKNIHNFFYPGRHAALRHQQRRDRGSYGSRPGQFRRHRQGQGLRIAYQQTFDFLPGCSAASASARTTPISQPGPAQLVPEQRRAGDDRRSAASGNLPLEQLSKHNVNVALFYEKGPLSLRAAYNWRSRFLLTAADVIFPYFPIFNDIRRDSSMLRPSTRSRRRSRSACRR